MRIIDSILGNTSDAQWQERAKTAQIDYLALNQWDAQKNRLRRTSENGDDIAVSLPRNTFLKNGDVLFYDEASKQMLVAKINLRDVMIIEIQELMKKHSPVFRAGSCLGQPALAIRCARPQNHCAANG